MTECEIKAQKQLEGSCNWCMVYVIVTVTTVQMRNPPLGVEVVWEFQEFQDFQCPKGKFKRRKRVAKVQRRKRVASINFVSNVISSCSMDLVLQVFNFHFYQFVEKCLVILINS